MFVASEDATPGSVIANPDRMVPSSNGFNQVLCCSGLPYLRRTYILWKYVIQHIVTKQIPENLSLTSMLPVSGALQLKICGANRECPIISHKCAYSRLLNPAPRRFPSCFPSTDNTADASAALSTCKNSCFSWGKRNLQEKSFYQRDTTFIAYWYP